MTRRGRRRLLDEKERALWAQVVRSVTPLRPTDAARLAAEAEAAASSVPAPSGASDTLTALPAPRLAPRSRSQVPPQAPPPVPPLATLEPKARRRLTRGAEVDARLDLHGMTQAAAHRRLRQFLKEAQAQGHSVVLVITGKGEREPALGDAHPMLEGLRGVLRRAVPHWLTEPDLRTVVLGFEEAGRRHGGEGALYVRIRRRRAGP